MRVCIFLLVLLGVGCGCGWGGVVKDPEAGQCPEEYTGLVPHPTFCAFYYMCDDGVPHLRECPPGLHFNPLLEACDFPENVQGCEGGTYAPSSPTTTTTTTTSPPTTTTTTTTVETPETEGTEPSVGPTTTTTQVTTTQPTTTTTRITTTTTPPGGLPCPNDPSVFMPFPGDCSRYYLCQNGSVVSAHNCQSGLWFRFTMQACMTPWGGDCVGADARHAINY